MIRNLSKLHYTLDIVRLFYSTLSNFYSILPNFSAMTILIYDTLLFVPV